MILVDTSIWIETFRRKAPLNLLELLEDHVATPAPYRPADIANLYVCRIARIARGIEVYRVQRGTGSS